MTLIALALAVTIPQSPVEHGIIPEPASVRLVRPGRYALSANASIRAPKKWERVRALLVKAFRAEGNSDRPDFHLLERTSLKSEEYRIGIGLNGVEIEAGSEAAAFYAFQTLSQIDSEGGKSLPFLEIKDAPRYPYRGLMVDVARHFWKVDDLKRFIETMATYKFNRLHLHLTDDQGWRIEHPNWPKLKEVAAHREETDGDGMPHSGSYSRADLRQIVAYASERHVEIVPEVDLPGHASALIAAYPELSCFPREDFKTATEPGVYKELLCPAKPRVFEFMRDIFKLLGETFPGAAIHLGGNDAALDRWRDCPNCKSLRDKEKLAGTDAQLAWFFKRAGRMLPPAKKPMFWFEEGVAEYPSNASVYAWRRGRTNVVLDQAAKGSWPVVVSASEHASLDYPQLKDDLPKVGWMPVTSLEQSYQLDPDFGQSEDRRRLILGVEGILWGEHVEDAERAFYMAFPRGLALSEAAWSPMAVRSWPSFRRRAQTHRAWLKARGIEIGPVP